MPGKLIWLVGPSGSGKDSLLAALRQREHPQLLVAHRYITRPFNAGNENHIALSEHEFFTRAEQHLFALSWHANHTYYGIGVEIDLWLHAGFDVVANGSRAHLALARERYGEVLVPICLAVSPPMSLTLRLTGTGGAQLVPAFGCDCAACRRARREESHRRRPCSGVVTFNSAVTLLDAGRPDLMEHHPAGSFQQVLLTHYHLDHVQGLFPLRWGVGAPIPVYGPPDDAGCDDLLKHPGLLDFSHTVTPFVVFELQGLRVTPLPLNHSKLTFGYLLESAHSRVAWLSDTAGLPDKTLKFLLSNRPQAMIIDCSHEPRAQTPRNHNDFNTVRALNQAIGCPRVILTHISHQFDVWMMDNPLPEGFEAGYDGMEIVLD